MEPNEEFGKWIDTEVLADTVADELMDNDIPVTLENMQEIWFSVLEDLPITISSIVHQKQEMGKL